MVNRKSQIHYGMLYLLVTVMAGLPVPTHELAILAISPVPLVLSP